MEDILFIESLSLLNYETFNGNILDSKLNF